MQSASTSAPAPTPEAIQVWLQKEMGYRPLGPYSASSKSHVPSVDAIRKICRGNMIPIWNFLINRVKSEKTVANIRMNITVHGGSGNTSMDSNVSNVNTGKEEGRSKGRRKEKAVAEESSRAAESREAALQEREMAAKEVERLRNIVRRQRKDLKARMCEVSREEAERKRMLDERANYRHKQVMLEAYDQQCDEAARIFAEYHKRLQVYVNQARDAQRSCVDSSTDVSSSLSTNSVREAVYSTVKGRNGIHSHPEMEATKLGFEYNGEIFDEMRTVIANCLRSPPVLLQAIAVYTLRLKTLISREIEKIDARADAEILRYKYENNRVTDISSSDVSSPLSYQFNGYGKIGTDTHSKGSNNQLLERQKAHVQQFLATEDAVNKAAEARDTSQKLLKRLYGSAADTASSHSLSGGTSQNVGNLRQFELEVWAKEREAAGLKASLNTLMSEIQRLNKLCAERKEAEDSLKKKWKKIEEFDARRSELETIYTTLLKANMDAAAFWNQQPLASREYASATIIPACEVVADISNSAKYFIEKEVSAFFRSPDNTLYMLPATGQALLESMGANGSNGPEALASAEKNAAMLTARAGARDPSAIPSICRISAALQYPAGLEGSDSSLGSVLESLEFCLKLRGSEACILEDLAKAINLVHIRQDLVESGHALLDHAYRAQQGYERTTKYCLDLAAEQDKTITEKWLPELKSAVLNAQASLEHCKYVRGLLDEWWEQPAATVVNWVAVDGQNVTTWHNHVKQLLAFYDKESL
ncbi:PREDICTED: AUGMIN subunit 5-like isoform X2 [Tarenaya hassleriana]|uniref:AUGMIN subunit 5-like isoform X2 n=1 Tax=Tarenaya hassleriana TaxID=28532 RepID=UPI00053C517C|nr:PREDICTED: AUGMIN subunit 5-like isoform X2 [Tarenaya hassleriana]